MDDSQVIAVGVPEDEGKFCADCKHLIGVRYDKYNEAKWNCGHPNNDQGMGAANLVTGIKRRLFYKPISVLRYPEYPEKTVNWPSGAIDKPCGTEGRWYEKYDPPVRTEIIDTIGGAEASELVFDDEAIAAGKRAAAERLAAIKAKKGLK